FNRIIVTNTVKSQWSVMLQRDSTNKLWAMAFPMKARADGEKVDAALEKLENSRIARFVSDDPKADLESFGLQPPALTVALGQDTNTILELDFGRELTNSPGLIFARRRDQNAIVAVSTNALGEWNASYDIFRDRHLLTLVGAIDSIKVNGLDHFSLRWQTNGDWSMASRNFPVDQILAARFARALSELQVADFEKDSVTEPDFARYGLTSPTRKYTVSWAASLTATNPPTELDFGTNSSGQIFARRIGEDAVYGIAPADFEALPSASWELRDRQIWNFDVNDVASIAIPDSGQTRQVTRNGTNGWSLTIGTNAITNDSCIEDTTRELGHLSAFAWVGHGAAKLPDFGFYKGGYQLSIQLKNGPKLNLQIGGTARLDTVYASVMLDGEPWIFEFPPDLLGAVRYCLTIPSSH